ncbi:MAG: maltose ABC transporter substrate-binding protein [Propionibacterium sp.]|nr:maltose ABC transporter substrate-binding protein [Propionibacterium sp.]
MRKSLLALAATGLAFALTACGSPSSGNNTPAGSSDSAKASGTLTLWADETRIEGFNAIGEAFQKATGVKLEVVQKPTDDVRTDFIAQAPSGAGPDLIVGPNDWVGGLVKNGVVAPVELGDKANGFSDAAKKAFTSDGTLYGVPYAVENIALVRNNALAKDTPATFDELIAQGKQLTPDHPVLIQQGDKGDAYHLYPVQSSFGAPLFKPDTTEIGMKGEAGEKFAAYIKKLTNEGVLSESIGGDQAKQAFLDGKSPYIITGPWWTGEFTKAGLDISVLPVPSAGGQPSAPFIGVQGVYLSSYSKNALLANQFLDYMAGDEAQKILQEKGGRLPALKSAAAAVTDPVLKGFEAAGESGQSLPAITGMDAVWSHWGSAELSILRGEDPVTTWQQMIANVEDALAKG